MVLEIFLVIVVALAGSFLSFFSGFGLGTLLLPVFMIFMPPHIAVAATAVVHMLNNIFKLFLVGRYANRKLVISFGGLSIVGALIGAWLLGNIAHVGSAGSWQFQGHIFEISWIKLVMAALIIFFTLFESRSETSTPAIDQKWMPVGGLVSGFFGGLSGHQGALRSAFLLKAGLSKEAMIGTRVVIACLVDLSRLGVYATDIGTGWQEVSYPVVGLATLAAFTGAFFGNRYMKQSSPLFVRRFISWCLVIFAIALGAGIL